MAKKISKKDLKKVLIGADRTLQVRLGLNSFLPEKFYKKEALHYLKVMRLGCAFWQPECRYALEFAIRALQRKQERVVSVKEICNQFRKGVKK